MLGHFGMIPLADHDCPRVREKRWGRYNLPRLVASSVLSPEKIITIVDFYTPMFVG